MIIYHHNDPDGRCAAAIVIKRYLETPGKRRLLVREVDYKTQINLDEIEYDDLVVVVDFSFKPERMHQIQMRTKCEVVWIDHHVTAQEYGYEYDGLRDFTEHGPSGCELTWKFLFPNTSLPRAVELIGDHDSWRLKYVPSTFQFYEGVKLLGNDPSSKLWQQLVNGNVGLLNHVMSMGETAVLYRETYCESMRTHYSYEALFESHKAFVMNAYRFGPKGFGEALNIYPLCIAFVFDGSQYTVSIYSHTVDVSELAKRYNGGGHKGAAGFVCKKLPFEKAQA